MVLRTLRTSFILAGLTILVSTAGNVHGILRANLTGQGSTLNGARLEEMSTLELRQHLSAPEQARRSVSAEIALGSMLFLMGMGLHAFLRRRKVGDEHAVEDPAASPERSRGEQCRRVKVHAAPVRSGRDKRKMDRWFLWMTVRI